MKKFFLVFFVIFGLFLFACNKEEETKKPTEKVEDKITLSVSELDLEVGETKTFTVTSTKNDVEFTITSGSDCITFSESGTPSVTGVKEGTAQIKATIHGTSVSATLTIRVKAKGEATSIEDKVLVSSIEIFGSNQMEIGASQTLTLDILPNNATNKSVTWLSSNASIATVNEGLVEAKAAGTTIITVMANDGSNALSSITIIVKEKEVTGSITLSADSTNVYVGNTLQINASVESSSGNKEVEWSVDSTKATIDENGLLTASKRGLVIVTCSLKDNKKVSGTLAITIKDIVNYITIEATSGAYNIGDEETLFYEVHPTTADEDVIWLSSNTDVMTVDENGKITAVGAGTVTITAIAKDNGGGTGELFLRVRPYVSDFELTYKESMYNDETQMIHVKYIPNDALSGVTFASSNEAIATVNAGGFITPVGEGEVTITVKSVDAGGFSKDITVTIIKRAERVEVTLADPSVSELEKGSKYTYDGKEYVVGETVFSSLAMAIETATKQTILAPGEYTENVKITESNFSLIGPNKDISPLTGTRGDSAIIKGTITIGDGLSNITINGLDFTGKGEIKLEGKLSNATVSYNNIYDTNTDVKAWSDTRDYTVEAVFNFSGAGNMDVSYITFEQCKFNNVTEKNIFLARNKNVTVRDCGFYNFKQDAIKGEGGYNFGEWKFINCEFINDTPSGCNGIYLGAVSGIDGDKWQTIDILFCTFKNIGADATLSKYHCAIVLGGYYQEKGLTTNILYNTFENCPVYVNARNNGAVAATFETNINYNKFIGIPSDVYHRNCSVSTDTEAKNPSLSNMDYNLFIDNEGNVITDLQTVSDKIIELASCTNNFTSVEDYENAIKNK